MDMSKFSLTKHDPIIIDLIKICDHKILATWAIDCLNRVIPYYMENYPTELTPFNAINILKKWQNDEISMWEARKYCWSILKLAKILEQDDKIACLILRATSHTLATCHVKTHAEGCAMYIIAVIKEINKNKNNVINLMEEERTWQINKLNELMKE